MAGSNSDWDNLVNQALTYNPRIIASPGLASDAIQSPDPSATAPLLVHSAMTQGAQQSAQDYLADSPVAHHWWDGVMHGVATATEWMAKPLGEIQKDYKFIHSVYTRHGVIAGAMATAAVAAGGTIGLLAGGPIGMAAGVDLAATGLRTIGGHLDQFKDSYNDSNDENYKVSFGRDVANALGARGQTDSGWAKFVSGGLDATFDVYLDPLMKIGIARQGIRSGKFIESATKRKYVPMVFRSAGVKDFLERNSLQTFGNADNLTKLWEAGKNPTAMDRWAGSAAQLHRAFEEIAPLSGAEIGFKFPQLKPISYELGLAKDSEEVYKVFLEAHVNEDIMNRFSRGGTPVMPSRTLLRSALSKTSDKFLQPGKLDDAAYNLNNAANFIIPRKVFNQEAQDLFIQSETAKNIASGLFSDPNVALVAAKGAAQEKAKTGEFDKYIKPVALRLNDGSAWATALSKKVRTFSGYQPMWISDDLKEINTQKFDPASDNANNVIYSIARFALGHRAALNWVNEWNNARYVNPATGVLTTAPDLAKRKEIYLGLLHETVKAAGFPNDGQAYSDLIDYMGSKLTGTIGGNAYGYGYKSNHGVSTFVNDEISHQAALTSDQVGKWSMPDLREFQKAMRSMNNVGQMYGKIDEFVAKQFTDSIFKPFALLTAGFGVRVAASELIPTMIRFGGINTARGKLATSARSIQMKMAKDNVRYVAKRLDYNLAPGEENDILAHAILAMSGNNVKYVSKAYKSSAKARQKGEVLVRIFDIMAANSASASKFLAEQAEMSAGSGVKKSIARGLSKIATEYDLQCAAEIAMMTGGHMGQGAVMTGHGIDKDPSVAVDHGLYLGKQYVSKGMKDPSGAFRYFTPTDHHFVPMYLTNLQKASQNIVGQSIARDFLEYRDIMGADAIHTDTFWDVLQSKEHQRITSPHRLNDPYAGERQKLVRYQAQEPDKFAFDRIDNFRNLVTGADGTVFEHLVEKIANGIKPLEADIINIPAESMPKAVIGNELVPYIGKRLDQRLIQEGFKKVIDPIIGHVSREPMFFQHYKEAMRYYRPMIEAGRVSEATGIRLAMQSATNAMVPQIHNPALRTQFSVLARNYLPFYFAQEQATKRYLKLAGERPEMFRAYQLIEHAINDPGFIQEDNQGGRYLVIPGIGELSAGLLVGAQALGIPVIGGLPVTVRGNMESLKTVLPETTMPSVSPMVSVAGNWLASIDPALSKYIKPVVGDIAFGQQFVDTILPSAPARAWWKAMNADERDRTFSNAMLSAIAAANYNGQVPSPDASPAERQAFIDRIKNNARSILIIKGILNTVSPLAPQVTQEDPGLRDEFYNLKQEKGDYPTALQEFLKRHGDKALSYTVAKTEASMPGANMPYTTEAMNWIKDNESLIKDKPAGAVFLVPQGATGGDAQLAHDELLKMHLRSRRTSEEFLTAIYTAAGNNQYFADKAVHDERVKSLTGAELDQENANWDQYKKQFALMNPIWNNEFQSPEKRNLAVQAYTQLSEMFANGTAPAGAQTDLVRSLFDDYQLHLRNREALQNSISSGITLTQENDNWQAYLDQKAKEQPLLTTVINGIFRRMD